MTPLDVARAAQGAAVVAGVALAVRRRSFIPAACYLASVAAMSWARALLRAAHLEPAREAMRAAGLDPALTPFTGGAALAAHLDAALLLAGHALLVLLGAWLFLERRGPALAVTGGAWALLSAGLALAYPASRGSVRAVVFTGGALAAVAAVGALAWSWARRREAPGPEHVVALLGAALTLAALLATKGALFTAWPRAGAVVLFIGYGAITAMEVLWLFSPPRS